MPKQFPPPDWYLRPQDWPYRMPLLGAVPPLRPQHEARSATGGNAEGRAVLVPGAPGSANLEQSLDGSSSVERRRTTLYIRPTACTLACAAIWRLVFRPALLVAHARCRECWVDRICCPAPASDRRRSIRAGGGPGQALGAAGRRPTGRRCDISAGTLSSSRRTAVVDAAATCVRSIGGPPPDRRI